MYQRAVIHKFLKSLKLLAKPEDEFNTITHHHIGEKEEQRSYKSHNDNHGCRNHSFTAARPRHLGGFSPNLLKERERIGSRSHLLPAGFSGNLTPESLVSLQHKRERGIELIPRTLSCEWTYRDEPPDTQALF
jgi:hypothetical protein